MLSVERAKYSMFDVVARDEDGLIGEPFSCFAGAE
jgi:hypothetical protein